VRGAQVIFTADDFGRSTAINQAIVQAHQRGVLTSASLMVTGEAVSEAVALARANPSLAVGLHVVVAEGRSVLPRGDVPHLVDGSGRFCADPARAGLYYFFNRQARAELAQEVRAQFERFAASGLPLSHVDGHMHLHLHPAIFPLILSLAEQYGAYGLRLPRDDLGPALCYEPGRAGTKLLWWVAFGLLGRWCCSRLKDSHLVTTERVYGLLQTGRMAEEYVVHLLRRLRVPSAEFYFHPTLAPNSEPLGPNPGDLETLLSPVVRHTIEEVGLRLATYATLAR